MERRKKAEYLQHIWMGSNLKYEGIEEVLKSTYSNRQRKQAEPTVAEVNSEWKRLAAFMGSVKNGR